MNKKSAEHKVRRKFEKGKAKLHFVMVGILKVIFQFVSHWIRDRDGLATVALRESNFTRI
jgi:hypothetical protein